MQEEREIFVKFRTRLVITSLSIILVPLLLTSITFLLVGSHIEDAEAQFGFLNKNNASFIYTIENYSRITEEVLEEVKRQIAEDATKLENKDYLDELTMDLKDKSSYIIVRKNDQIFIPGIIMRPGRYSIHCRSMGMPCLTRRRVSIIMI